MKSPFESATRVAIEEIILGRVTESKFGFFMSKENVSQLTDDIFELLKTSRNLKAVGDRMLQGGGPQPAGNLPSTPFRSP